MMALFVLAIVANAHLRNSEDGHEMQLGKAETHTAQVITDLISHKVPPTDPLRRGKMEWIVMISVYMVRETFSRVPPQRKSFLIVARREISQTSPLRAPFPRVSVFVCVRRPVVVVVVVVHDKPTTVDFPTHTQTHT